MDFNNLAVKIFVYTGLPSKQKFKIPASFSAPCFSGTQNNFGL
jgi:hypothetical protein